MNFFLYLYLILHITAGALSYSIPVPKVQILSPQGFRISIPHVNGIKLVGYHISIDKAISLNKLGDYSADITLPTNGHWVYEDTKVLIIPGNIINYWVHVQHWDVAHKKLGGEMVTQYAECEISLTTVHQKQVCKGDVIFEDHFDNLDWTMWKQEIRIPMEVDDGEFVSFQSREENCFVNNGQLHIIPNLLSVVPGYNETSITAGMLDLGTECTAIIDIQQECVRTAELSQILPPVVSARIRTKDFFSFRFGTVEVRAKLPRGDWVFPLILLEPLENHYGYTRYASGQMRVAFNRGNEFLDNSDEVDISCNRIYGGVVLSTNEQLRDMWLESSNTLVDDDFHIYTLTWAEDYISLGVDGSEYGNIRGNFSRLHKAHEIYYPPRWDNGHIMAPFDREFYLTLGVSVGGHSDFPDGCLNGENREEKPWGNRNLNAELEFWNDREKWFKSWNNDEIGLLVDYVKVYAL